MKINKSQAEHSLKHDLGKTYGFILTGDDGYYDSELTKDDLDEDYSLTDWEEFTVEFKGDNWQSKIVQYKKLINHIK